VLLRESQSLKLTYKRYLTSASQIFGNAVTKAKWQPWQMLVFPAAGIRKWLKTATNNK
jgi:hypothetical protein